MEAAELFGKGLQLLSHDGAKTDLQCIGTGDCVSEFFD